MQAARQQAAGAPAAGGDIHAALTSAAALHRSGDLDAAEAAYRRVLTAQPENPDVLHLLGLLLSARGDHEEAAALTGRAADARPDVDDFGFDHGAVLQAAGRPQAAEAAYRRVIDRQPEHLKARYNLAVLVAADGRTAEAVPLYRDVLTAMPDFADGHYNLANALRDLAQWAEAEAAYRRTLAIDPHHAGALNNLGMTLRTTGRLDDAVECYRRAIDAAGPVAEICNNLGVALTELGMPADAEAAFRQAIAAEPNHAPAHNNLGVALQDRGRLTEAVAAHRRALELDSTYGEAHNNLGNAWRSQGDIPAAIESYRAAIRSAPDHSGAHSNLILAMNYVPELQDGAILSESRLWTARFGNASVACPLANDRDPDRRLRVGYVSPDLRRHSVAYFLAPLLEAHASAAVETVCYADVARPDDMTDRLRGAADHWRSTVGLPDGDLAALIRDDRIDILVDLAGHTAGNRLAIFAGKPAPVQVSWLGYPNTTGLDAIDYRLTDGIADPVDRGDEGYTERLYRLPNGFLCFALDATVPGDRPRRRGAGEITFGSFNNVAKLSTQTIEIWTKILNRVPNGRLVLKSGAFADQPVRTRCRDRFAQLGVAAEQVELLPANAARSEHLAAYRGVDIALDTTPYNGTTTTCEALYMGVPVVTLAGTRHAGRVGASLLTQVGLSSLVATTPDDYVGLAVDLAGDPDRRRALSASLPERLRSSPLSDAAGFARDIEAAFREMWRTWCAT